MPATGAEDSGSGGGIEKQRAVRALDPAARDLRIAVRALHHDRKGKLLDRRRSRLRRLVVHVETALLLRGRTLLRDRTLLGGRALLRDRALLRHGALVPFD